MTCLQSSCRRSIDSLTVDMPLEDDVLIQAPRMHQDAVGPRVNVNQLTN